MKMVALGEVAEITMGQAPPGDSYNEKGIGLPLVAGAGDFAGSTPRVKKFTAEPGKVSAEGDIILGIRASIGERVWSDRPYCLGRGVAGLRPLNNQLDRSYLWHWLDHAADLLKSKGRGATFLQVNRSDIRELEIPLPPLDQQRRIAAILDQADDTSRKQRAVLSELDRLEQSVFRELFGDPSEWRSRWPMGCIGDMAESVQYGTSSKAGDIGEWPIVRMGNVTDAGRLDLSDLKWIDLPKSDVPKFTLKRGDLLFNRTNSKEKVGKTCVVATDQPLAFAGYLVRVRLRPEHQSAFVNAFMTSRYGQALRKGMAKAAVNQANINATEMKSIPIAIPPSELQREFATTLDRIDAGRGRQLLLIDRSRELFASLQASAFRGELTRKSVGTDATTSLNA